MTCLYFRFQANCQNFQTKIPLESASLNGAIQWSYMHSSIKQCLCLNKDAKRAQDQKTKHILTKGKFTEILQKKKTNGFTFKSLLDSPTISFF